MRAWKLKEAKTQYFHNAGSRSRGAFFSQEPLLYTCFPHLCLHKCIHPDNRYLLNYLLLVRKRQNKLLSEPRTPPLGSLCLGATQAGGCPGEAGPSRSARPKLRPRGRRGLSQRGAGQVWPPRWPLGPRQGRTAPIPVASSCPLRPRRPRGPDSVAATSQRARGLGFPTSPCLKAGQWWPQGRRAGPSCRGAGSS